MAIYTKRFTTDGTWTTPPGVKSVSVQVEFANYELGSSMTATQSSSAAFISSTGAAYGAGENDHGQLGNNSVTAASSPSATVGGLTFSKVIIDQSAFGITTSAYLYAWGRNRSGNLGDNSVTPRSSPVLVSGGLRWRDVTAGNNAFSPYEYTLGLTVNNSAYGWGANNTGQLGVGDLTDRSSPVIVVGSLSWKKVLATRHGASYGLTTSNVAYAWGRNAYGQLGVGDVNIRSSPTTVQGSLSVVDMSVGTGGTLAFFTTAAGEIYGVGFNQVYGALGVGDTTDRSSPTLVVGGLVFDPYKPPVVMNDVSVVALTRDGLAYAWGRNHYGQLGDGSTTNRSSPVAVAGSLRFRKLVTDPYTPYAVLGLTVDGDLYAWGENTNAQLGSGDLVDRSSPTLVVGSQKWVDVYSPNFRVMAALNNAGDLYTWGDNPFGALGVGDTNGRSSPTLVTGGLRWSRPKTKTVYEFTVTPNQSNQIILSRPVAMFNGVELGTGRAESLLLMWEG